MLYLASKYFEEAQCGQSPSEALERALLSNANLGGDCCNRGLLLGSLLGACFGASNIPLHLLNGLKRKEELIEETDLFTELILQQLSTGNIHPSRFGRPSPFPTKSYSALSAIQPPRDFRLKLELMKKIAAMANVPVKKLRFKRDIFSPLDEGDAARDRKEALASSSSTSNKKAIRLDEDDHTEDVVYNQDIVQCESGSGVFYYPQSSELVSRLDAYAKVRSRHGVDKVDPVTIDLFQNYGIQISINRV